MGHHHFQEPNSKSYLSKIHSQTTSDYKSSPKSQKTLFSKKKEKINQY